MTEKRPTPKEVRQLRAAMETALQYGMKLAYADTETTNKLNTCAVYHKINFPYREDSDQEKEVINKVANRVSIYLSSWVLGPIIEAIYPEKEFQELAREMGLELGNSEPQPNTFKEMAMLAKKSREAENNDKEFRILQEAANIEAEILNVFNEVFAEYVPMLKAENITYYPLMKDKRYEHLGFKMVFEKDGHVASKLLIDKSGLFNYKGSFGNWPTDFFPEWLYDNLLVKLEQPIDFNQEN